VNSKPTKPTELKQISSTTKPTNQPIERKTIVNTEEHKVQVSQAIHTITCRSCISPSAWHEALRRAFPNFDDKEILREIIRYNREGKRDEDRQWLADRLDGVVGDMEAAT
jgi:hypothetical protein